MGISPIYWSDELWKVIHKFAFCFPLVPDKDDIDAANNFYSSLQFLMPCEHCRAHYKEYININKIKCNNRRELFQWTLDLHNAINVRLHKPIWNLFDAYLYYSKLLSTIPIPTIPIPISIKNPIENNDKDDKQVDVRINNDKINDNKDDKQDDITINNDQINDNKDYKDDIQIKDDINNKFNTNQNQNIMDNQIIDEKGINDNMKVKYEEIILKMKLDRERTLYLMRYFGLFVIILLVFLILIVYNKNYI